MRELTGHKVNGVNDGLTVVALDEPGYSGACHNYRISGYSRKQHVVAHSDTGETEIVDETALEINFQNGPLAEAGINGVTGESLLAVLIDRYEGFQSGKYKCAAYETALDYLRLAQTALHNRTRERLERGVEGTHTV